MFRKAKNVTPTDDHVMPAHFTDGSDKLYDIKPLFDRYPVFMTFETVPGMFRTAKADVGGYGIVWNEDIDTEEVYQNGHDHKKAFTEYSL